MHRSQNGLAGYAHRSTAVIIGSVVQKSQGRKKDDMI